MHGAFPTDRASATPADVSAAQNWRSPGSEVQTMIPCGALDGADAGGWDRGASVGSSVCAPTTGECAKVMKTAAAAAAASGLDDDM